MIRHLIYGNHVKTLAVLLVILMASCNGDTNDGDIYDADTHIDYPNIEEYWTLYRNTGIVSEDKQYYFHLVKTPDPQSSTIISVNPITPVVLTSGRISLEEDIQTQIDHQSAADISFSWFFEDRVTTVTGLINGDEMSGQWTQKDILSGVTTTGAWRAEKGIVAVQNGSFEKDLASGKTRLFFRAWTEDATRVYITADFIEGPVDLSKCGKTRLSMDIWTISADPACSGEGYYEFPSVSDPLIVKTHIVKTSGEIVREKTITDGVELNGVTN